jgi:hypothetical protein
VSRRPRIVAALPGLCTVVVLAAAAIAVPDRIAAAIRAVFRQATLGHLLPAVAAVGVLAVLDRLLPSDLPARRPLTRLRQALSKVATVLGAAIDRTPPAIGVTVVAAWAAAGWYALGRAVTVPRVFGDELIHAEVARRLAGSGALESRGYGLVTPVLDAIAYLVTGNDVAAYRTIQVINVLLMATAAFPAYWLARRTLSHRWALLVAALTVTVPWFSYSSLVMTEAAFYPVFLLWALALVRALERPTLLRQTVATAALALAYATRTQAIVLAAATVCAIPLYGWARGRIRETIRAFAATGVVYGAVGMGLVALWAAGSLNPLGAYAVLTDSGLHPRGLALWAAANLTSLVLGLGVLTALASVPGVAALLRRSTGDGDKAVAITAMTTTVWLLVPVVVLSQSRFGQGTVHERNLFFVVPLIVICAIAWAARGLPRSGRVTAIAMLAMIGLAVAMPSGVITAHAADALSFKLWTQLEHGSLTAWREMVAAVVVGAIVIVSRMRRAWPLVLTIALSSVAVAAASDVRSDVPRSLVPRYSWIDRALSSKQTATLLWIGYSTEGCGVDAPRSPLPKMAVYSEFFNSRLTRVGHLLEDNPARGLGSDPLALRTDGTVLSSGAPLRSKLVVLDARVRIVGSPIATLHARDVTSAPSRDGALTLWRAKPPVRLQTPSQLLDPAARRRLACE